ncbi:MAG: vesicle formation at the endoplasmic reticulum [Thelocarpon impressellum]|nr:MAG: vesicle formation at the endoplasmic reticulum [Thelocarpon impressellum]
MYASAFSLVGLWTVAGALAGVDAAPLATPEIFERLPAVPEGWSKSREAEADTKIRFRIALKSPKQAEFEQTLLDVSTPDHARYGQHLSSSELKAMLRPRGESTDSVLAWLSGAGVSSVEDAGEWVNFVATVEQAEAMLHTDFAWYRNDINQAERLRTLQYSVPHDLREHIAMIQPTTRFGQIRPQSRGPHDVTMLGPVGDVARLSSEGGDGEFELAACNTAITPECLRRLYNIKGFKATKNGKLGIAGYLEQVAKYDDLETFFGRFARYAVGTNFSLESIKGGIVSQDDGEFNDVEANLDAQYGLAMSAPIDGVYYSTAGRGDLIPDLDQPSLDDNQNEPYLDFLTYVLALPDAELPQVLTTSYGEDEQSVPEPYSRTVCNLFGQLGARGVSVLFSSGDTGPGSACQTNDGKNTTRFLPIFPGACPWVTSVGGTTKVQPEEAIGFSSGGFSDRFPRPAYQDEAIKTYLGVLGDKWKGLYNPDGRGFPDISAQSANFQFINRGNLGSVGGTSASAPTVAGMVSLLNSARAAQGKAPLGFLNPFIYSQGKSALNDIVKGKSRGCTGVDIYSGLPTPFVPDAGWDAVAGWDPVTGHGTPDFDKLLKLAAPGTPN